jgi:uncharacterized protein
MKPRTHDPQRLDVEAFAADGASLEGGWPLAGFVRLIDEHPAAAAAPDSEVRWRAHGRLQAVAGGAPQVWLELEAQAAVLRRCQRCLQPVTVDLQVRRRLRFVEGETQAAELDADSDDDVLAIEHALDLHALVEDELLLALPMVPRHAHCAAPAAVAPGAGAPRAAADGAAAEAAEAADDAVHPFAALAHWRARARPQ